MTTAQTFFEPQRRNHVLTKLFLLVRKNKKKINQVVFVGIGGMGVLKNNVSRGQEIRLNVVFCIYVFIFFERSMFF